MLPVESQTVVFVGGKGGVGKTTTASALALGLAGRGERTLLVSTDPAHSLGDIFDRAIGDEETALVAGLWALEIDPEREVERYLRTVKRNLRGLVQPRMYDDIDRQIELTRRSPGAQEAALLERLSRTMIEAPERYDRVVFDTAPTGSTLRLLALPEVMTAWMEGLLERRERADSFRESLRGTWSLRDDDARAEAGTESATDPRGADPDETDADGADRDGADRAGTEGEDEPERSAAPVDEDERARRIRQVLTERRRRFARARTILQDPEECAFLLVLTPEKLPILEGERAYRALRRAEIPVRAVVVNRVLPDEPLGSFLERRREQEADYLREVDRRFDELPRVRIPLLEEDVGGLEQLRVVARHLEGEE